MNLEAYINKEVVVQLPMTNLVANVKDMFVISYADESKKVLYRL